LTLAGGLVLAAVAWSWLFRSDRGTFWSRALVAGSALALYAVAVQRSRLLGGTAVDVAIGVGAATVLYGVFWLGDRVLGAVMPGAVTDLYGLASGRHAVVVSSIVLVASAEELFWRGFVQERAGLLFALAAYTLVHVPTRRWALVLAAAVAGAFWGTLFEWRDSLVAPVVSHVLWDLALVVWWPLRK
jgi:membrane protease YdiL (CAAX protease family)